MSSTYFWVIPGNSGFPAKTLELSTACIKGRGELMLCMSRDFSLSKVMFCLVIRSDFIQVTEELICLQCGGHLNDVKWMMKKVTCWQLNCPDRHSSLCHANMEKLPEGKGLMLQSADIKVREESISALLLGTTSNSHLKMLKGGIYNVHKLFFYIQNTGFIFKYQWLDTCNANYVNNFSRKNAWWESNIWECFT